MIKKIFSSILLITSLSSAVLPNNIVINNISLLNKNTVQDYVFVRFDIHWENSWKISTGPKNWDAAWVFIKFRVDGGSWQHATLSENTSDHSITADGTVDPSNDGKGVFIYRTDVGSGTFSLENVQLKWLYGVDNMADNALNLEIKVFGIEMVYINEGPFYVGDGVSTGRFWDNSMDPSEPAYISNEPVVLKCTDTNYDDEILEAQGILVDGDDGIDVDGSESVDNNKFPTGYKAFYCMKHEITNEQYAEFLNTLSRSQQDRRTFRTLNTLDINPFAMTETGQLLYRCCVRYVNLEDKTKPVHFFCDLNNNGIENEIDDGQNVGIVNLGWADGAAYADWAGLRPMTELEFEKASRGADILPVAMEKIWGNTTIAGAPTIAYTFINFNTESEYPENPWTGIYGNASFSYTTGHNNETFPTDRLDSPIRVGMFATSSSDRVNAGASYYGVLDLGGNVAERCVAMGRSEGRNFKGTHGDGYLTTLPNEDGNATNLDWPGITRTAPENGVNIREGSGYRGGDWNDSEYRLRTSDRYMASEDIYYLERLHHGNPGSGFRCVRSVD